MDVDKMDDSPFYDEWANIYDKEAKEKSYQGPNVAARALARILSGNRKEKVILDFGGGTGLVGEELKKQGFEKMDILDSSDKMLEIARQRRVYQNVITAEVKGPNSTPLAGDSYDAVLGVAVFCTVVPSLMCSDIKEMIRLAKPGGLILVILRTETLYSHLFRDKLLPLFDHIQSEGTWKQLERSHFKYMYGVEGQLFVYQKL